MTTHRTRPWLRWGAAVALGVAATLTTSVNAASAAETEVVDGHLDWGFKASFRQYVSAGNGTPPISASGGATINTDGTFRFPVTGGSYDPDTGTGMVNYGGAVVFSYPAHFFEITLANPTVVIGPSGGTLFADIDLVTSGGGFEPVHEVQAEIAALSAGSGPVVDGATVRWANLPATLTDTGAQAFAGFYTAGTELDPVSVVLSTDGAVPAVPAVTVLPATGLDPAGATIQVAGSGFNPTSPGINVAFGPQPDGQWWLDAGLFQTAKWVHPSGNPSGSQDRLQADGTFQTTLEVAAVYTDGNGETVDCRQVQCYVVTMRAHGQPDRSQDTLTPVSFAGSPPAGGGTAQQQITVDVVGGPLTLAVAGDAVTLTDATIGGTATGALHEATVEDLRGTNAGWSLVGQVGEFTGTNGTNGTNGTIAGGQLGWAPAAVAAGGGGTVTPGATIQGGLDAARALCSSAAGASAGTFECGAQLNLSIPEQTVPGRYTATLTLTLA